MAITSLCIAGDKEEDVCRVKWVEEMDRQNGRSRLTEGWQWVRFGDVCEITMGQSPDGSTYNSEGRGVPLLNGPTEFGPVHPTPVQWTTSPVRFAERGDILLCVRGATTGRKNIADQRYCIGRGLAAIRGNGKQTFTDFLLYVLDLVTVELLRETAGSTFPNLPGERLANFKIPLPPLPEQKRIASILNEQLTAVEQARAAAEAQLEAAKELPAAYLREVFDSPEARKWPRKPLGESCLLLPSKSIATNGDTNVRAITTACLTEMGFDPSGVKQARMWARDATECLVSAGEILIARSNTPELVGRVAMFTGNPERAVASDLTIRIWPRDEVWSSFLTGYLASLYVNGY